MYKSLADVFNSPDAVINDPYDEIHNPVKPCRRVPEYLDYLDFIETVHYTAYPKPTEKMFHHIVNPEHGPIKPVTINCK